MGLLILFKSFSLTVFTNYLQVVIVTMVIIYIMEKPLTDIIQGNFYVFLITQSLKLLILFFSPFFTQ